MSDPPTPNGNTGKEAAGVEHTPLVTVLITTYNQETYIAQA